MRQPERRGWFGRLIGVNVVPDVRWPQNPLRRRPDGKEFHRITGAPLRATHWVLSVLLASIRARRLLNVQSRAQASNVPPAPSEPGPATGLNRCDIRFINLDHRTDRREQFEIEMKRLGVSWHQRIPGVIASPGALGCARAHVNVLDSWRSVNGQLLLVCEDDAQFVAPREEIDAAIEEFVASPHLQVLMLAHNAMWRIPISNRLGISASISTAAAFILRPEVVPALRAIFQQSADLLEGGMAPSRAAIDVTWKRLQRQHVFALTNTRCAIQRPSYSDIEQKFTEYKV